MYYLWRGFYTNLSACLSYLSSSTVSYVDKVYSSLGRHVPFINNGVSSRLCRHVYRTCPALVSHVHVVHSSIGMYVLFVTGFLHELGMFIVPVLVRHVHIVYSSIGMHVLLITGFLHDFVGMFIIPVQHSWATSVAARYWCTRASASGRAPRISTCTRSSYYKYFDAKRLVCLLVITRGKEHARKLYHSHVVFYDRNTSVQLESRMSKYRGFKLSY